MLTFDPAIRITVPEALQHPWLASYHEEGDEPNCPQVFDKWKQIEELETLDDFRKALWEEIEDYRKEVRGISDIDGAPITRISVSGGSGGSLSRRMSDTFNNEEEPQLETDVIHEHPTEEAETDTTEVIEPSTSEITVSPPPVVEPPEAVEQLKEEPSTAGGKRASSLAPREIAPRRRVMSTDPVMMYARRSSILQPSRQGSTYNSPVVGHQRLSYVEGMPVTSEPGTFPGGIAFPTSQGYVVPARSRTGSMAGGEVTRKLLRTLSTVSINESAENVAGGLAQIAPIGKYIVREQTTADAPVSEMPQEFASPVPDVAEAGNEGGKREKERKIFHVD
jgi:hypothetical protein